jgi:hypothetical protein
MTLAAAIIKIQAHAIALSGMGEAPTNPTEAQSVYPYAITYDRRGAMEQESAGWALDLCTVCTEFHFANQNLSLVITKAMGFREPFLQRLISDPTLGDTVSTIRGLRYEFGKLGDDETSDIGYKFEIDLKLRLIGS